MNANLATRYGALNKILESLGMTLSDTEQCAGEGGYRIDFEKNFTIELQHLGGSDCRLSARIFGLGKSLQVQENQIKKQKSRQTLMILIGGLLLMILLLLYNTIQTNKNFFCYALLFFTSLCMYLCKV